MLMTRMCNLDEKTSRSLRYTNEIKTKMYSVQKLLDVGQLIQERDDVNTNVDQAWPEKGEIKFDAISLRYRPQTDLVIRNLTFDISPGKKIGIVGRTGSGKTTLGLTLSRLIELENGKISIDGVDISKISL